MKFPLKFAIHALGLAALFLAQSTPSLADEAAPAKPPGAAPERARAADTPPSRVEMTITVEARGFTVGEGKDVFEHDGREYHVVSEARTAGIVRTFKRVEERRESQGTITGNGIRPTSFRQERTGKPPKSATFDWANRKLRLSEGAEAEVVDLPALVLDQTSLPYAFVFAEPPRAGIFRVQVTDGRRLTDYEVAFVGEEALSTPLGDLSTLHYRKIQRGDDRRGFEFWLSLNHFRLPVRIRIVEKDGTAFDSNVTHIVVRPR